MADRQGRFCKRALGIMAAMLLASLPLPAQEQEEEGGAVPRLMALLGDAETMRADVRQLTLDQSGREIEKTRATLVMRKPDQFYWHTTAPYEEVLTTDGETLWIFEPDLNQVTLQDFDEDLSRTPALLLSEDAATLKASFDIGVAESPEAEGGGTRFTLDPRDPGSLFERLSLTFAGGKLREMQFADSLGQQTSLSFDNVETNVRVDETLFTFEVPPGVEVIDNTTGG